MPIHLQEAGEKTDSSDDEETAAAKKAAKRKKVPAVAAEQQAQDRENKEGEPPVQPPVKPPVKPPGKPPAKGKPALKLTEVIRESELMLQAAVQPELTPQNGVGRFVLVPAAEFGGAENVGGWVGKIVAVDKRRPHHTKVKMCDGNQLWAFAYVAQQFKPLS